MVVDTSDFKKHCKYYRTKVKDYRNKVYCLDTSFNEQPVEGIGTKNVTLHGGRQIPLSDIISFSLR